jgi:hypothetical protein
MVESIPPEVIVPSPAPVIEEVPVTVLEPAVALEPEIQQNSPSTEDQAEVESDSMTPKIEIPVGTYPDGTA